jgi:hypothetical protein
MTAGSSSQHHLAVIYDKLGRRADTEAALSKIKAAQGDAMWPTSTGVEVSQ